MASEFKYLEDLLLHLRQDPNLEECFSDADYFAKPKVNFNEIEKEMKADCPVPRSLWVFPGNIKSLNTRETDCKGPGVHEFYIVIMVQCIRDHFQFEFDGTDIKLSGQYMELSDLRCKVRQSVLDFNQTLEGRNGVYDFLIWKESPAIDPNNEKYLMAALKYETKILGY